jgi:hypothetical protein
MQPNTTTEVKKSPLEGFAMQTYGETTNQPTHNFEHPMKFVKVE